MHAKLSVCNIAITIERLDARFFSPSGVALILPSVVTGKGNICAEVNL